MINPRLPQTLFSLSRMLAAQQATWRLEQELKRLEWQATCDATRRSSEGHLIPIRALRAELEKLKRQRRKLPRAESHPTFTPMQKSLN